MKKFILVIFISILYNHTFSYSPPKNLEYGMTYDEIESTLNSLPTEEKIKIGNLEITKDLPSKSTMAKLKDVKLFKKKATEARVVIHDDSGLSSVQYAFTWDNKEETNNIFESSNKGRDQCWEFHENLIRVLKLKYGEPLSDESEGKRGNSVVSGTQLRTTWIDPENKDKIIVSITRQKKNLVLTRLDTYIVAIVYNSRIYTESKQIDLIETEDL